MSKRELIAQHREAILALAAEHGATDVRIFGSVARGDETPGSDLDVIVRFPGGARLAGICGLAEGLEQLLDCKVDLITDHSGIGPRLRRNIEEDAIAV